VTISLRIVCITKVMLTSPMNKIVVCNKFYIRSTETERVTARRERKSEGPLWMGGMVRKHPYFGPLHRLNSETNALMQKS
jgi:hypothetical protein